MTDVVGVEVEPLLRELVRQQWTLLRCGRREAPVAVAAYRRDRCWADVVVLRGHDRAIAYRTLMRPGDDPLTAAHVVWHYISNAQQTLQAVLNVSPDAVAVVPYPIPAECRIPELDRRPLTIRPGQPYGGGPAGYPVRCPAEADPIRSQC